MKFEIKAIEIKERIITANPEIIEDYDELFKSDAEAFEMNCEVFKESESNKLFDFLYNNSPVHLTAFDHTGERSERVNAQYTFEVKEKIVKTITPNVVSSFAGKNVENYNSEILKQLKSSLKIATINPFDYNISFDENQKFDVFVFYIKNGHAHKVYGIVHRKSKELSNDLLALLADWNLCFGFRSGNSSDINDNFKYQEIIIHTD